MEEIWKDIPNHDGYQASNLGKIRTHNKITYTKYHGIRHWEDKILKFKPSVPKKRSKQGVGYRVDLCKDCKHKYYVVSRLVSTTFLEDLIDTKMTVNHKDGNRLNNCVDNLEWVTRADNIRHAFANDLMATCKKVCIINTKNKEKLQFYSMAQAERYYKLNNGFISRKLKKGEKDFCIDGVKYEIQKNK